jgi:hypothetical protein
VERLEVAATVALGAGANVEALRHLRAALELATPDRHLDLYERMGDTTVHGDTNIDALMRARQLAQAAGVEPARQLRILAGILTFHTRWQGSVVGRPSEAELEALFDEGRNLLDSVDDDLTRARFRAAEAFLPFWVAASGRENSEAEFDAAAASANEALELAIRLDDTSLQSAALDGLGGLAQVRGNFAGMATTSRQRLALGERLAIAERIDAACMLIWAGCVMGDLAEANRVAEATIRTVQPGQATNWALHLLAWTTLAAELSGDWDRAGTAASRAYALWADLDRVAAGYSMRGFFAAYDVARARGDDAGAVRWQECLQEIMDRFRVSPRLDLQRAVLSDDLGGVNRLLAQIDVTTTLYETVERIVSFVCDRAAPPDAETLAALAAAASVDARLLQAQLHRARGIAHGDVAELRVALEMLTKAGARPGIARLQIELGRATGDEDLVATGRRTLEEIGDVEQLDRYRLATAPG